MLSQTGFGCDPVLMAVQLDHVFICTAVGAPAAERLREFGLTEGSPNKHAGQGTACRRFFFRNAMLELLWVEDEMEARSEQTVQTRLWERWSAMGRGASPFGIILRPQSGAPTACPFKSWEYRPPTMPDLIIQIADGTGLEEPMWCWLEGGRAPLDAPPERRQPLEHTSGLGDLTGARLTSPAIKKTSVTQAMANAGVIILEAGDDQLLELAFDDMRQGRMFDLRPDLPLVLRS